MRNRWRVAFLSVTAIAIGMELFASCDGDPETDAWTNMIVQYVPGEAAFAVIGALCLWLPIHFGLRYWKKRSR